MSNVSYDLDTSGGLMPLIRALIKPPDDDSNGQKPKKPQHPYYKRPGKGHNHDSCDACGEGGDLICCDRCPASFHLGCYDPPLDENDIPTGQWLCKQCSAETDKASSSRSSRAQSPADSEKKTRALRNRANSSAAKKKKDDPSKDKEDEIEETKVEEEEKELSPMEVLVKAAKIMNPKQFELPKDMMINCPFPGTDKPEKSGSGVVSVDAWGQVPLPAKACFVCRATCKLAPLIQCDYCPLLFHQDCLDPPLTALPTGRWMCPNHVEQYIDWKLVNSISATERVALWDKYSGPIDHHAIKMDFLKKARNKNPRFRMKVPVECGRRVVVPGLVKAQYARPPPLLPSRREYVRCTNVLKQLHSAGVYTETDQDYPEKVKICLNLNCPKYTGQGVCTHDLPEDDDECHHRKVQSDKQVLKGANDDETERDLKAISDDLKAMSEDNDSDMSESDYEDYMLPVKRKKMSPDDKKKVCEEGWKVELEVECEATARLLAAAQGQLRALDRKLVTVLACQRLHQIVSGAQWGGQWGGALGARAERAARAAAARAALKAKGEHLPSQLLSACDVERISRAVWGAWGPAGGEPLPAPPPSVCDLPAAAALTQLLRDDGSGWSLGTSYPLRRGGSGGAGGAWRAGSGAHCAVPLAVCRRADPLHALIYHDQMTNQFELINYGSEGTVVNGVLYTSELARDDDDKPSLITQPRAIEIGHSITKSSTIMPSSCGCATGRGGVRGTKGAWEGAAVLPHGALIQFGCLSFVFTITDEYDTQ